MRRRAAIFLLATFAFLSPPLAKYANSQPVLPQLGGTGCSSPTAISDLGDYEVAGTVCVVNDADDATDCLSGGGAEMTLCCFDGADWFACGGGGGASSSGDVEAVGDCVTGPCFTDGGTGDSLIVEGSTADTSEFTLQFPTDPAADYTATFPSETGTVCTTGSTCSGYSASAHTHTLGDTAATGWFTGSDGANKLYFEGATANGFEGLLTGADFTADRTLTLPDETGTICSTGSVCPGYGDVGGPSNAIDGSVAAFSGTTGKLLEATECYFSDADADNVLDEIHCPEGFTADARDCDTNADCNYIAIHENTSGDASPTCTNSGISDKFSIIPQDDNTVDLCYSTTKLGQIAQPQYDGGCTILVSPTSDQEVYNVWIAPAAFTITSIKCESTGGTSVLADFEIDDGSPTGVNGSNITCTTSLVTDATLSGDTTLAAGDRLDLDLGTVTGSVTQFSICIIGSYDS